MSYTISQFCADVLKRRFPGDAIRQEMNETDNAKLNFACPFCGDSASDHNKKRGNLYLQTQTYKCYNDGCMAWVKLEKFISFFSLKYKLDLPDVGSKKITFVPTTSSKKKGFLIEFLINKEIAKKLILFKDLVNRFSLSPCYLAPEGSPIRHFIEKRKINTLSVFEHSCYYDSREDKVYIFNLDLRSGRVLGFAIRKIDDSSPGPKYNIKNYSELKKNGLATQLDDELISDIDSLNNYFNILNIDFSKPVIITEGQIDAMFLNNSIATTGVTKSKQLLESIIAKKLARILFDNDSAGKRESIALLKRGYYVFLWSSVIREMRIRHPKENRDISKIKDINDLFKFMLSQNPELTFDSFNEFINEYFSNSMFDLILI